MASAWGKFLCEVVVPDGGWTFAWTVSGSAYSATVAAGTYDTVLELLDGLESDMASADGATWAHEVSQVGIVTLTRLGSWSSDWGNTTDALATLLGFAETEDVGGGPGSFTLTGTSQHTNGWYPGVLTFGTSKGAGLAGDTLWQKEDTAIVGIAGNTELCIIDHDTPPIRRQLTFRHLDLSEVDDRAIGVEALWNLHRTKYLRWYPDRSDGTTGTPGSQIDPYDETEDDGEYYRTKLDEDGLRWDRLNHPKKFQVEMTLLGKAD